MLSMCGSRGGTGGPDPLLKNHKNKGFSSNIGPESRSPEKSQLPSQHSFCWRADDCPLIVALGSSRPSSTKKKNVVKAGPPLTKLPGSVHATWISLIYFLFLSQRTCNGLAVFWPTMDLAEI